MQEILSVNKHNQSHCYYRHFCPTDTAKLTEAIHKQGLLTEGKDYTQLTTAERNQIRATAEAFAVVNKKSAITAKERDIWTEYFHNRAIKTFNKNCLKELLAEHKSETVI